MFKWYDKNPGCPLPFAVLDGPFVNIEPVKLKKYTFSLKGLSGQKKTNMVTVNSINKTKFKLPVGDALRRKILFKSPIVVHCGGGKICCLYSEFQSVERSN